jgi:hypothetical protein
MATYLKAGLYAPPGFDEEEDDYIQPLLYIDEEKVQVVNEENDALIVQFTYEELRGLMAIMAAEQEKQHLFIKASAKNN